MEESKEKHETGPIRHRIRTVLASLLIVFLAALAAFLIYFDWTLKTPLQKSSPKKLFEVKNGESTRLVAGNLEERSLIRHDWAFFLETRMKNTSLQPGIYELSADMSAKSIIDIISSGKTKIVKITIPEGYRTEQIAQVLAKNDLVSFNEFVSKAKKYEGKLFPDTYYFSPEYGVEKIIEKMLEDYNNRTAGLDVTEKSLIIASIVEREAINNTERPIIAGIYENRLKIDMKMEADPTVQYGRDNAETSLLSSDEKLTYKYWKPITSKDYHTVDSIYNTYEISGLPPAPICNPGLASIEAAINYQDNDFLYFIQAGGNIYPAKTYKEHEQNKKNYL